MRVARNELLHVRKEYRSAQSRILFYGTDRDLFRAKQNIQKLAQRHANASTGVAFGAAAAQAERRRYDLCFLETDTGASNVTKISTSDEVSELAAISCNPLQRAWSAGRI